MTDTLLDIGDSAHNSPHYLRIVTDMAERCPVVTQDAIYSESGIKLVDKGARIDSRLYDRLVQHKLREPLDAHLSVENAVGVEYLHQTAVQMLESDPLPMLLRQALGDGRKLTEPLRHLPLTQPVAFKLTVMREQMPNLFLHSLQMALVSLYLGVRSGLESHQLTSLAAAALLHDLGALHMDPSWRDPRHKVTGPSRKHLIAHPITAMLMVRDAKVYSRAVEVAVLEHHERMDGSGYPRGLAGKDISVMGQILLLAEVVTAFYEKYLDSPAQQLSLVLRLNHRKFPGGLVAHVLALGDDENDGQVQSALPQGNQIGALASQLAKAFAQWEQLKKSLPQELAHSPGGGPVGYVENSLLMLKRALTEAGAHPDHHGALLEQLQGDEQGLSELAYVVREAMWQLEHIVYGCQRRWHADLEERSSPAALAAAQWCEWVRSLQGE
ncbi:HD domain-containing phosphohydrolase [Acidovorax sp. 210-6]|jgi:hypothetical protein|uniref:HD-GYP domain-containing protein n=1 Tax=Acidovorax sp. 210-6 TaxID=2699468 RepID=UPI001F5BF33E|nr:HD domain-containing phosphohydrolase [Acidovorax sp. 210-6]